MRFQLNGSVEVLFKIPGDSALQSLYFEADEFSRIDGGDSLIKENGTLIYRGLLDAIEDNIQVRLRIVAQSTGKQEKAWEILTIRQDVLEPFVSSDRIVGEFIDSDQDI